MRSVDARLGFATFVGKESNAIPGLLHSVRDYFEEFVVVCTNPLPDDGTWEYLRDLEREWFPFFRPYRLAVPLLPAHFDFGYLRSTAAHLNSCGYVFMLDADERITVEHLKKFKALHEKCLAHEVQVVAFPRHHWIDGPRDRKKENKAAWPDWQPRMIRNNGLTWFRRPVHETALYGPNGVWGKMLGCDSIEIHHHHDWYHPRQDKNLKAQVYQELASADPDWTLSYTADILPANEQRRRSVRKMYKDLLERDPTPKEVETWAGSSKTVEEMYDEVRTTEEYSNVEAQRTEGQ